MHGAEADGRIPETPKHGVGQSPEAPRFDLFHEASPDDDEVAAAAERDAMALQAQLKAAEAAAEAAAEGIREPTSQAPPSQEPTDAVADAWSDRAADEAADEAAPAADETDAFRTTEKVDVVDEEQEDDNLEEDSLPSPHACPNKAEKDDEARAASVAIAGSMRMVKPHEEAGPEDAAEAVVVVGEEVDGAMAAMQQQRAPEDSDEGGDPLAPPPFYVSGDAIPSDAVVGMHSSGTYLTRRGEVRHIEAAAAPAVSQPPPAAATAFAPTGPSPRCRGPSPGIDEEEEELPPTTAMGPPGPPNPEGAPALPTPLGKKAIVALTADEPREALLARGLDDDDDARGPFERVATERVAAERVEAERVEAERPEAERAAAERAAASEVAAAAEVAAAESKSVISKAAAKAVAKSAAAETAAAKLKASSDKEKADKAKLKASSDKEKADKAKAKSKRLNSGERISINLCDSDAENEGTTAKPAAGRRSSRIASSACKPGDAVLLHFPSKDAKEYITLTYTDVRRLESRLSGAPPETLPTPLKRAHAATGSDGGAQGPQAKRQCASLEATTLFSTERMPNIILKNVPQQENDYDCGLYMLSSIEHLAAAEERPSFETAEGLIAHFSGATLPQQKAIDEKRANFYKGVFRLAEAQSQPDDPIVDSDSDGEKELEELRPSKRQRGGGTASDTAPSTADTKIGGPAESPPASASSSAAHGKRKKGLASTEPAAGSASKDVRRAGGVAAELASIIPFARGIDRQQPELHLAQLPERLLVSASTYRVLSWGKDGHRKILHSDAPELCSVAASYSAEVGATACVRIAAQDVAKYRHAWDQLPYMVPQIAPREGHVYVTHETGVKLSLGGELYHRILIEEGTLPKQVPIIDYEEQQAARKVANSASKGDRKLLGETAPLGVKLLTVKADRNGDCFFDAVCKAFNTVEVEREMGMWEASRPLRSDGPDARGNGSGSGSGSGEGGVIGSGGNNTGGHGSSNGGASAVDGGGGGGGGAAAAAAAAAAASAAGGTGSIPLPGAPYRQTLARR